MGEASRPAARAADGRRTPLVVVSTVAAVWTLAHPYMGVVHDARLYVVQALRTLDPGLYGADLLFRFGAQDDYSIFTDLLAPAIARLGLPAAAALLAAFAHALWLAGAVALAKALFGDWRRAALPLVFAAAMPAFYGGFGTFSFGEGFLTPRLFAEAATLWSLFFVSTGRRAAAFLALFVAAAFHPLYCLIGAGLLTFRLAYDDRRWLVLLPMGAAAALAAAAAGVAPFDGLFRAFDPVWLGIVERRSPMLFPSLWSADDWARLAIGVAFVAAAAVVRPGAWRALAVATLITALGGVALTAFGADVLRNVLLTQLQFYRADWVLSFVGHMATGVLLDAVWRRRGHAVLFSAILLTGAASAWALPWQAAPLAILGIAATTAHLTDRLRSVPASASALTGVLAVLFVGVLVARGLQVQGEAQALAAASHHWGAALSPPAFPELLVLALVASVFLAAFSQRRAALAIALAALVVGAALWDRRTEVGRAVEAGAAPDALVAEIPADADVYYEGYSDRVWFYLKRRSYVAHLHGAPAVFWRGLAIEYDRRQAALRALETPFLGEMGVTLSRVPDYGPPIGLAALRDACRRAADLDVMLLHRRVDGAYDGRWTLRGDDGSAQAEEVGAVDPNVVYLYDCASLRAPGDRPSLPSLAAAAATLDR